MDNTPTNAHRRKLLVGVATAAAAVPLVAGLAACQGSGEQETKAGASGAAGAASPGAKNAILTARRKLGPLEVSSVGLGVQNMSRTYQTTIPSRSEMHRIIRTAFDRGLTFYDAAEAYGPHEVERILGEGVAPFRNEIVIATKFGWNIDLETGARGPVRISVLAIRQSDAMRTSFAAHDQKMGVVDLLCRTFLDCNRW